MNTFESWDRSFRTNVEDQDLTDEVFNGAAIKAAPIYPEAPLQPGQPQQTNMDNLSPAESTQRSVTLEATYETCLKEWEIDIKEWQAEMMEHSADEWKYQEEMSKYNKKKNANNNVHKWVEKTVSDELKKTCCLPELTLVDWYMRLRQQAQKGQAQLKSELAAAFEALLKPVKNPPQNWYDWINEVKNVFVRMEAKGMNKLKNSETWF